MFRDFEFVQFNSNLRISKWSPAVKYLLEMTDSQLSGALVDRLFPAIDLCTCEPLECRLVTKYGKEIRLLVQVKKDIILLKDCTRILELYETSPSKGGEGGIALYRGVSVDPSTNPCPFELNIQNLPIILQINAFGIIDLVYPLQEIPSGCSIMSLTHPSDTRLIVKLVKNTIKSTNSYSATARVLLTDSFHALSIQSFYSPHYIHLRLDLPQTNSTGQLLESKIYNGNLVKKLKSLLIEILNIILAS